MVQNGILEYFVVQLSHNDEKIVEISLEGINSILTKEKNDSEKSIFLEDIEKVDGRNKLKKLLITNNTQIYLKTQRILVLYLKE